MKRRIWIGIMLTSILICVRIWADGSWSPTSMTLTKVENDNWVAVFGRVSMLKYISTFTSGTTNIPMLTVVTTSVVPMRLYGAEFKSGVTVPTSGTTVTIEDDYGVSLISTTWGTGGCWLDPPIPVMGNLTVTLSGNSVAGAVGTIRLVVAP